MNLANSVDEASVSEREVLLDSEFPVLFAGRGHDFLESRVDDIDLISTLELVRLVLEAHKFEELGLRFDLIFLGHTAWGDVIEVLEPFEVRAGDTTSVDKHVRSAYNSSALEDLFSCVGSGAIGTFEDSLNHDGISVTLMKRLLSGGWDHAVSWLGKELLGVFTDSLSGVGEANERAMLGHMSLDSLDIQTIRVVDGGVVLNNSGDFATVLLDELRGPVADSTEALDDESLVLDTLGKATSFDESLGSEKLANSVVDTKTSGLGATSNTSLRDEFTSAAALSIDISLTLNVHVGVLDPGHGLLVGAHIGTEAINLGADKALLDELHSVLTGHSLDLVLGVLAGVNLDTTLGTTEGNISDGELEGHEGSESLDFLQIDVVGVTSATFDGELVSGMLCSI